MAAIQVQIQALIIEEAEREAVAIVPQLNTRLNIEVAKPQIFYKAINMVSKFLTICRLYIRMRMKNIIIEG